MHQDEFDNFFKNKIDGLDDVPPMVNWDSDATLRKIENRLHPQSTPRFRAVWMYGGIAASVSLLIMATSWFYFTQPSGIESNTLAFQAGTNATPSPQNTEVEEALEVFPNDHIMSNREVEIDPAVSLSADLAAIGEAMDVDFQYFQSKESRGEGLPQTAQMATVNRYIESQSDDVETWNAIPQLPFQLTGLWKEDVDVEKPVLEKVAYANSLSQQAINKKKRFHFQLPFIKSMAKKEQIATLSENETSQQFLQVSVPVGVGWVAGQFAPSVGVQADLALPMKKEGGNAYRTLSAGINMNNLISENGEGSMKIYPNTFLEVGIGKQKVDEFGRTSGHSVGVGYLIDSTGQQLKNSTFKVKYTKHFKNNLSVSPELIVSDQFNKVFPGVTITKRG